VAGNVSRPLSHGIIQSYLPPDTSEHVPHLHDLEKRILQICVESAGAVPARAAVDLQRHGS